MTPTISEEQVTAAHKAHWHEINTRGYFHSTAAMRTALEAAASIAPGIDRAAFMPWLDRFITEQESVLERSRNNITQTLEMIVTGRIGALNRVRDHLNGIDEYPRVELMTDPATLTTEGE